MSDIKLTRFENNDGLEFHIDEKTKIAYASISATARMLNIDESNLRKYIKGKVEFEAVKAQIYTPGGLQGGVLLDSSQVFKLAFKYNPELAEKMGTAGANLFMLGMAGYQVKVKHPLEQDRENLESTLKSLPAPTYKEIKEFRVLYKSMYGAAYSTRWAQAKINKFYPQLGIEEVKPLAQELPSLPTSQALLTPTEIAAHLGWMCKTSSNKPDPKKVNNLLEQLGYQENVGGRWSASKEAISANLCDRKPVETNSRTQKDQLLWSKKMIDILNEHSLKTI